MEEAFRTTVAEVCDELDANIVTMLERNDWTLPSGSTFGIWKMPAIHFEAARVEYEPEE